MVAADGSGQQARLDRLQRRLYRRDATPADLEQYLELRDELAAAAPPPPQTPPDAPASRRRPTVIAGALLGAVALSAAVVVLQDRPSAPTSVGLPTTGPTQQAEPPQYQDGRSGLSARFTDDAAANPVGTTVEVTVDGTRVLAQRFSGSGPTVVPLVTGGAPLDGGSLTVTLMSSSPRSVSWRTEGGARHSPTTMTGAQDAAVGGRGSSEATTVQYRGAPASRIAVSAPTGTGWTLVVAFSR